MTPDLEQPAGRWLARFEQALRGRGDAARARPRNFRGQYDEGERWRGRRALVIGTGNSGHDIAQDLHSAGCAVTPVQRRPTLITNIEPSAQLAYSLYDEGPPTEDCDLITVSVPLALLRKAHQIHTARARELDRPLLDALERIGFKLDYGRDATGWQFLYLERGGGYYFNVGCSDLLVEGRIGLAQFSDFDALGLAGGLATANYPAGAFLPIRVQHSSRT